jgi:hypothetical protein
MSRGLIVFLFYLLLFLSLMLLIYQTKYVNHMNNNLNSINKSLDIIGKKLLIKDLKPLEIRHSTILLTFLWISWIVLVIFIFGNLY